MSWIIAVYYTSAHNLPSKSGKRLKMYKVQGRNLAPFIQDGNTVSIIYHRSRWYLVTVKAKQKATELTNTISLATFVAMRLTIQH